MHNMNFKKANSILLALLFLVIIFIGIGILSAVMKWTTLDLPLLLNKIFDFTLSLISFLVAFSLGQVYWDWRLKKEKSELLRQAASMYIGKIQLLALQARTLLEPVDREKVGILKDIEIQLTIIYDEIEKLCQVYMSVFGQLPLIEDTELINFYLEKVQPVISRLLACRQTQENAKELAVLSELILVTQQFQIMAVNH